MNIILDQFELGPMQNYIYFIGDPSTHEVAIVDPAWDIDFILKKAAENDYKIKSAILTHGHHDHTNGLDALLTVLDIPVFVSKHEASFYKPVGNAIKEVDDLEKIRIGNIDVECLLTPGHTPGSQCFLVGNQLIAGDTLFIDACGRCDFPGGSAEALYDSLHNRLMKLPDDTILYPGHNYNVLKTDTLGNQKKTNPYLKFDSLKNFLRAR